MNTNYERYGHLGVPMNPTHTSAALDAAHELTKDLTRNIQAVRHLLQADETVTLNTTLATFRADVAGQLIDELRTNLADLLSVFLTDDEQNEDDLTEDDGWHFGGVITATPDGGVVTEAGTGDDEDPVTSGRQRLAQPEGGGETGDAGADHDDVGTRGPTGIRGSEPARYAAYRRGRH